MGLLTSGGDEVEEHLKGSGGTLTGDKMQITTMATQPEVGPSGATGRGQHTDATPGPASLASILQQAISMVHTAQTAQQGQSGFQILSEYLMTAGEYKILFNL